MHINVDAPSYAEETAIAERMSGTAPQPEQVLTLEQLLAAQSVVADVFVHHAVRDYAVRLVMATRAPSEWNLSELTSQISLGASPRGTLGLIAAGRALATLRGRRFLVPQDVYDVAPEVLRHRILLTYDAIAQEVTPDDVLAKVLAGVPAPRVAPSQDVTGGDPRFTETLELFDRPAAG
jgi:MoxR-like ATPase